MNENVEISNDVGQCVGNLLDAVGKKYENLSLKEKMAVGYIQMNLEHKLAQLFRQRKLKPYHVVIPYYYHFYVEAEDEDDALEKAHNTEGEMGEYDDGEAYVEEV